MCVWMYGERVCVWKDRMRRAGDVTSDREREYCSPNSLQSLLEVKKLKDGFKGRCASLVSLTRSLSWLVGSRQVRPKRALLLVLLSGDFKSPLLGGKRGNKSCGFFSDSAKVPPG